MISGLFHNSVLHAHSESWMNLHGTEKAFANASREKGGYVANAVQTSRALTRIEICFIWIPIVLCVLIAVLTYFYKLNSIRGEMTEELEKRDKLCIKTWTKKSTFW